VPVLPIPGSQGDGFWSADVFDLSPANPQGFDFLGVGRDTLAINDSSNNFNYGHGSALAMFCGNNAGHGSEPISAVPLYQRYCALAAKSLNQPFLFSPTPANL